MFTFILLPFLTVSLHEAGTRKALLGLVLNNIAVYLTSLLVHVLKTTLLQGNLHVIYLYVYTISFNINY